MSSPYCLCSRAMLVLLAVLTITAFAAAQEPGSALDKPQEKEDRELVKKRSEWFYGQRSYPREHVPARARLKALQQLAQKRVAEGSAGRLHAPASTPSWTSIGPQPVNTPYTDPVVAGRVSAIAVVPGSNNTVYLGSAQGGIWKTTDGGTTWTALTDTEPTLAVGSIALDPSNSSNVYVGTGEENFSGDSYYGAGILKTTDGGNTWTHMCGPFCGPVGQDGYYGGGARIGGLAVHPTNGQILLAAVALLNADGIYRSTDGGKTWTQVLSGNPGTSVIFDPANGNTAYAALGNVFSGTEGVYKSTDAGLTWSPDNGTGANSLSLSNAARIVLAMAGSSTTTLYAGIANITDGALLGMYKTTDAGTSWTALTSTPDYCTPQCSYDNVIAVQPGSSPDVVYAGGAYSTTLIRSMDGGTTWSTLQSAESGGFLHADTHALAFSLTAPCSMLVTTAERTARVRLRRRVLLSPH